MTIATKFRFICNHPQHRLVQFVLPTGRTLQFDTGVLDTDEEGAVLIRRHALFGRTIFEGDPNAPAHGEIPKEAAAALAVVATPLQGADAARYCSACDETFANDVYYRRHMKKVHAEEVGEKGGEGHG